MIREQGETVNIIRAAKDSANQKVRRRKATWSTEYLYNIIKGIK